MFWYLKKLSVIISFSFKGSGFLSENFTTIKRLIKSFSTIHQELINTKSLMVMILLEFTFFFIKTECNLFLKSEYKK